MAIATPQFDYPFRLNSAGTGFVELEQDSDREILVACYSILATEQGSRDEEPEFGLPDQTFRLGRADLDELRDVVEEWEPRASAIADATFDGLVQRVKVSV